MIELYTDGAASPNPGKGGCACVLIYKEHRKELHASYKLTTNNRMEMMAVIIGLKAIKNKEIKVKVYSDSTYVVNTFNKGWVFEWEKKNFSGGKKNIDLWIELLELYKTFKDIEFIWIKGHNGHPENERCDEIAESVARFPNLIDEGYKP
jgi:ribonuclease HI